MEKLEYKNSPVLGFILNSKYYLYDRYSNSIFTVPRIFFEYLDDLISLDTDEFTQKYHNIFSKEEIIDLFKTLDYCQNDKKLIKPNRIPKFTISSIYSNAKKVEKKLKKELTFLCINITEECNLRCEYCIFSGKYTKSRRHNSNNQIEWNYIEKGVNLFLEHSTDSNIRKIGFYGGEPLLYFDIIRKTINYVRSKCDNAIFTITTNATLLKDKILSFFVENNNPIPISLFQVDNQWIYKGIYEDTLYLVNNLEPFARFSRKDISPSKTELEVQNSSFINHLFTSNGMSLFGYPQYQLKEVSEGIFDLVLVDFRAFLFNHADKQILEIEKMNCPPLSIIYEQKNLNDLFMLISSRNPKKLVLKVPAEFMGKEEDENPVLFISDLIYPKKKQPSRGKP